MVTAIILAGTRPGRDPVAADENVSCKALVNIGGITMLERVIDALAAAGIERIVVVCDEGPVTQIATERGATTLAPGLGPSDSAFRALHLLGAPLLITTADHALLKPEWIRQFLADAPISADVVTMLAPREKVEASIPGSRRTWLRFSDGHWSGCNLFLLRTEKANRALQLWKQVEQDRKHPWRIARKIGPVTLARYLLGKLSTSEAFASLGRMAGFEVGVVAAADGLAALDVDTVADLHRVRAIVEGCSPKDSACMIADAGRVLEPALAPSGIAPGRPAG
jgi:GTP:adenosylcobinamide-phosphate guanylyltransferase